MCDEEQQAPASSPLCSAAPSKDFVRPYFRIKVDKDCEGYRSLMATVDALKKEGLGRDQPKPVKPRRSLLSFGRGEEKAAPSPAAFAQRPASRSIGSAAPRFRIEVDKESKEYRAVVRTAEEMKKEGSRRVHVAVCPQKPLLSYK